MFTRAEEQTWIFHRNTTSYSLCFGYQTS